LGKAGHVAIERHHSIIDANIDRPGRIARIADRLQSPLDELAQAAFRQRRFLQQRIADEIADRAICHRRHRPHMQPIDNRPAFNGRGRLAQRAPLGRNIGHLAFDHQIAIRKCQNDRLLVEADPQIGAQHVADMFEQEGIVRHFGSSGTGCRVYRYCGGLARQPGGQAPT
jgi:hypothetical protein